MNFTEEQHALAEVAGELFAELGRDRRTVWDDGVDPPSGWSRLAELGLTGIGVPEEHGGSGGGLRDLVLVCEQAGRHLLADPFVDSVVVAGPLLAAHGDDEARARWLPALASGDAVALVRIDRESLVLDADRADVLLTPGDGELVVSVTGDVVHRRVASEDLGRRTFRIEDAVGRTMAAPGVRADALARGRVGVAATLNGVNQRLVEMAVDHAKVREQFDQPIGAFQAVQHRLADLHVAVDATRATAWAAAAAVDRGDGDAPRRAMVAKAKAATTSALVNVEALQLLGGIGFTWEHDLHLWLKRGLALAPVHGSARELHRTIGRRLLKELA